MTYGTELYSRALEASTLAEMREIREEAGRRIGNRAPAEQEEYLVYGYADGWLEATRKNQQKMHQHMMLHHHEYRERNRERVTRQKPLDADPTP